jgi:hypothetical protein
VVDQDLTHGARGDAHEVPAALGLRSRALSTQADPGLVHEGRGLQRVTGSFALQTHVGSPVQLGVDEGKQALSGLCVPFAETLQEKCGGLVGLGLGGHGRPAIIAGVDPVLNGRRK